MTLTIEQTDKILQKLRDYGFEIIDKELGHKEQLDIFNIQTISEEYFNERVNEGLEEEEEEEVEEGIESEESKWDRKVHDDEWNETLSDKIKVTEIDIGEYEGTLLANDVKDKITKWEFSLQPDDKPIDCLNKLRKIIGSKLI